MSSSLAAGGIPAAAGAAAARAATAEGVSILQIVNAAGAAAGAAVTSLGGSPAESGMAASQGNRKNTHSESYPVSMPLPVSRTDYISALHSCTSRWWQRKRLSASRRLRRGLRSHRFKSPTRRGGGVGSPSCYSGWRRRRNGCASSGLLRWPRYVNLRTWKHFGAC